MALLTRNSRMPNIKPRPTNFNQGKSFAVPSPYGGLNLREDITALKANEARVLENFFPSAGVTGIRPGYTTDGTGLGSGEVKTLTAYNGPSSVKLIAGANGKLFNVTTAGAGTQLATGFSDDRWQTECYNGRSFFVNGTDAPQDYNGTAVAATSWTGSGLTITNLVNISLVRNRLWFCENNSADVWYGGIGSITGALTKFQLSQIAGGGHCMAIGSWSRDSGDGADDFTVFIMSTGEVIIYQGDPASSFSLQGKYDGAPPVGRQCAFKVGGELIIITSLGLLPVSAAIAGVALDLSRIDPWGKIAPGIVADVALDGSNAGWHGVLHEGVVYINVPQTPGVLSKQWVLNTRNGTWTTYTKWNASSLCSFNGALYFGAQTGGTTALVGADSDDGTDITAKANGAFTLPNSPSNTNLFTAVRPKIRANGSITGLIGVDVDYLTRSLVGDSVNLIEDTSTTPWGSEWGSEWGQESVGNPLWFTIIGSGRAVSVRMQLTGAISDFEWYATDVLFKPGGIK